jgi:hypothetical protein
MFFLRPPVSLNVLISSAFRNEICDISCCDNDDKWSTSHGAMLEKYLPVLCLLRTTLHLLRQPPVHQCLLCSLWGTTLSSGHVKSVPAPVCKDEIKNYTVILQLQLWQRAEGGMKSENSMCSNIVCFWRHWPCRSVSGFRPFSLLLIDLSLYIPLATDARLVNN